MDDYTLIRAFDDQVKLVDKSLQGDTNSKISPNEDMASKKKDNTTLNNVRSKSKTTKTPEQVIYQKTVKKDVKKNIFSHHSRKFRFEDDDDNDDFESCDLTPAKPTVKPSLRPRINNSSIEPKDSKAGDNEERGHLNIHHQKDDQSTTGLTMSGNIIVPPPIDIANLPKIEHEDQAHASMLMSWYMAGYHTGYFEAMKKFKQH